MMRWLGPLLLCLVGSGASQVACGTSAVGVEDCRSIERARCQAARPCNFGIDSNSDEEVCLRFARDNCLHGMLVQAPTAGSVTKCVNAINGAGTCATKKKDTPGVDCAAVALTSGSATVCELIENPEQIPACEFLTDQPKPEPTATPPKDSGSD
jgi:hypothetical protein